MKPARPVKVAVIATLMATTYRSGHLLEQRFVSRSRYVHAIWSGRKVYLMGVPEMDHAPSILPEIGEQVVLSDLRHIRG
jgi:hypothetical protein